MYEERFTYEGRPIVLAPQTPQNYAIDFFTENLTQHWRALL